MAAAATFEVLKPDTQKALLTFLSQAKNRYQGYYQIRNSLLTIDRDYYREADMTKEHVRASIANRVGDASKYQDVTPPIVMPQVETFVTYQSSVFLSGEPLFGVVASSEYEDAALAMEAVIGEQATKGAWKAELIRFFRDLGKYNLGACEVYWGKKKVPTFETDINFSTTQAKPKTVLWEGNSIKKLDLYNSFWDTQCHPREIAEYGEYAGYNDLISRTKLKQIIANTDGIILENVKPAFESSTSMNGYYIPQLNPTALLQLAGTLSGATDWMAWAGLANGRQDIAYKGSYLLTTLYVRMLPSEFAIKCPQANTPQVWKLLIVNDSVIILAERQTNAHDLIPILFCCPNDDDIKYQSKSLGQNVQPLQQAATSLMAAAMASRRRAISDRGIYNPLYIDAADINNSNPASKIPCKPTAYAGVSLSEMYYSIPYSDDQSPYLMQGISGFMGFADIVSGQNKSQQGQFVKGNKTLHEYEDVMGNANGRSQLNSIILEDQFFSPLKQILGLNILQYQQATDIYHDGKKETINIDPIVLRNSVYKFTITDGELPSDKVISADAWQTAMQVIGSSPAIGPAYNIAPMFSYLMKTQGADISDFEKPHEQLMYEQAVQSWQQTVLAIMKQNPEVQQSQLPPQPLPAQFGLGNDGKPIDQTGSGTPGQPPQQPSIFDQLMSAAGGVTDSDNDGN